MSSSEEKAQQAKAKGNEFFQKSDFENAIKHYTEAIGHKSDDAVFYSNRSACFGSLKKFEEALKDAEKAVELRPTWGKAWSRKATALHGLGNMEAAFAAYEEGLKHDPENAALKQGHGELQQIRQMGAILQLAMKGNFMPVLESHPATAEHMKDAEFKAKVAQLQENPDALAQLVAADPRISAVVQVLYQDFLQQMQQQQQSRGASAPSAGSGSSGAVEEVTHPDAFDKIIARNPYVLCDMYATWCGPCKRIAPAVEELANANPHVKFVKVDVDSVDTLAKRYGVSSMPTFLWFVDGEHQSGSTITGADVNGIATLIATADRSKKRKDAPGAGKDKAEEPMEEEKKEPEVLSPEEAEKAEKRALAEKEKTAGNAAFKAKDWDEALARYNAAFEIDGTNVAPLNNIAAVYFQQGEFAKSVEAAQKAVNVGRDHNAGFKLVAKAFERIGNAQLALGEFDLAIKAYDSSLTEHRSADVLKKRQKAEKDRDEAARLAYIDPEKANEEREAGNALFKGGDYPGAMKHYNEAVRRNPEEARLYTNRAACYIRLMEYPSAVKDCNRAIELEPSAKAYVRRGNAQFWLKDYKNCMESYEKALELEPENAEARAGLQRTVMKMQERQMGDAPDEESIRAAQNDPEIRSILSDPVMNQILQDAQTNPASLAEHMRKSPAVAANIDKLVKAGILRLG